MKNKIYVFVNGGTRNFLPAVALSGDGHVLDQHMCSTEGWVLHDMGIISNRKHESYNAHYPNGWELEYVSDKDIPTHEGLNAAFAANKLLDEATRKAEHDKTKAG